MFVIPSSRWKPARATGQARLVADLWLEALASDVSPVYSPPLCSSLQLLHNLRTVLHEIDSGVLRPYHAKDIAAEILERGELKPWLLEAYPAEWEAVKSELQDLRKADDQAVSRHKARLLIAAFVDKVEKADPIRCQLQRLGGLALDTKTSFDVLARAVGELSNDLLHRGHSRDFLHDWLLKSVLPDNGHSYLDNLLAGGGLGKTSTSDYSVLFGTYATPLVPNSDRIQFVNAVPGGWGIPQDSLLTAWKHRLAVVKAPGCLDWLAAVEQARGELVRYLGSIPLAKLRFDRAITESAAAHREPNGQTHHQKSHRRLFERSIAGAEQFYKLRLKSCSLQTYAELDRVMYWYEQSRGWDDLGRLIALWTALEFLFGQLDESAVRGIQIGLPAYVVPQYARLLVLDLRTLFNRIEFDWPGDLLTKLQATAPEKRLKTTNLLALLEQSCEEDATNLLHPLVKDYPNLTRKIRRIYRCKHSFKKSTDHPAIWHDIEALEQGLLNDLRFAYRARNQIVHAAAVQIVQLDRLVQRLNWMLCTTMDVLIHQFANHPARSLRELHEANLGSFRLWKETLKSEKPAVPPRDILQPACHGLPTGAGGQP
jgi:hypothetical protein